MPSSHSEISASSLMEEAVGQAGSDDFGDPRFTQALELLLASCRDTKMLSPIGWRVLRSSALSHLRNRLLIQAFVRAHPHVADEPPRVAIVVTGLPRTGTTVLQNLLALDANNRFLRLWEALRPVPPGNQSERAALVERSRSWLERFYELVPGFRTIHALAPEGPEECDALLQNSFASQHFDDMFHAPAYSDWLASADLAPQYSYYALQLRVLASADTEQATWVLKSPLHVGHLDALGQALPGALVVHCHRDPLEVVSSYASLICTLRRAYIEDVSPRAVGRQALRRCETALARALATRASGRPGPIVDVSHRDLVRDPIGVVRRVYRLADRPLGDEHESRMRQWIAGNPRDRHGDHRHNLSDFGLTEEDVTSVLEPHMRQLPALTHR